MLRNMALSALRSLSHQERRLLSQAPNDVPEELTAHSSFGFSTITIDVDKARRGDGDHKILVRIARALADFQDPAKRFDTCDPSLPDLESVIEM